MKRNTGIVTGICAAQRYSVTTLPPSRRQRLCHRRPCRPGTTPFQAAWDVLEVVRHDQERLTCQRPRSDPGPDTSSTTRLSRNTTLTLLPDSILPYLLDHHELLADIRVAIERQHPLIALKFTEVLIKRCIDLPKHSQQLIVHEVHAQPIAPFGIVIIRKNQVTGPNGYSTSSVKLHPKVHAHRWFVLILIEDILSKNDSEHPNVDTAL